MILHLLVSPVGREFTLRTDVACADRYGIRATDIACANGTADHIQGVSERQRDPFAPRGMHGTIYQQIASAWRLCVVEVCAVRTIGATRSELAKAQA